MSEPVGRIPPKYDRLAHNKHDSMVTNSSWEEFRASGLAWWINRLLHTFGWALVFEIDPASLRLPTRQQRVVRCYPARCRFRGFDEETEAEGFKKLTAHMEESMPMLKADLDA